MARGPRLAFATSALNAAARVPFLSPERERALFAALRAGDAKAGEEIASSHLKLVFFYAAKFAKFGSDSDDLLGEGTLALAIALERFDPAFGVRFASYATWWIRAHLRKQSMTYRRAVRPPESREARNILANFRGAQRALWQGLAREPTLAEVAAHLRVRVELVESLSLALLSRDVPAGTRGYESGERDLPSRLPSPEDEAIANELRASRLEILEEALADMTDRERLVFERYHLGDDEPSLRAIGDELGFTRERARQLEERGMSRVMARCGAARRTA